MDYKKIFKCHMGQSYAIRKGGFQDKGGWIQSFASRNLAFVLINIFAG